MHYRHRVTSWGNYREKVLQPWKGLLNCHSLKTENVLPAASASSAVQAPLGLHGQCWRLWRREHPTSWLRAVVMPSLTPELLGFGGSSVSIQGLSELVPLTPTLCLELRVTQLWTFPEMLSLISPPFQPSRSSLCPPLDSEA